VELTAFGIWIAAAVICSLLQGKESSFEVESAGWIEKALG
jgi:hypothetical protein